MTTLPQPPERPDEDEFRQTMARFVTGVTVMTTVDPDGQPHGMTANAVASLSLDPLLVLVCVERSAAMARAATTGAVFALSVLAGDQQHLSDHFADVDRGYGIVEFESVATTAGITGAPLLVGASAWVDCRVHEVMDGGDHVVVVGEVLLAERGEATQMLLYTPTGYDVWPAPAST